MIIALFPNASKPESIEIAKEICQYLKQRSVKVVAEKTMAIIIGASPVVESEKVDFQICLGGDGTILRLLHRFTGCFAPLLGINMGSLGFLADIPADDIFSSLEDLIAGKYTIQKRLMIEGSTSKEERCFAINEIVVHRGQNPGLIDLEIAVDGRYLNTFAADGVILSTPTGSTAYSLAAGGPILTPELEVIIITPICPHTISNRPIVLFPSNEIRVTYHGRGQAVEISYDGITGLTLAAKETLTVRVSKSHFKLVNLNKHDTFSTLRKKLGWQGKLRPSSSFSD